MNASNLIASIKQHVPLQAEEENYILSMIFPLTVKQGDMVEKSGEVSRYFMNVKSGCLMTYFTDKDGFDHVIQFATAGWWTGDLHSISKGVPSIYATRALADSEVLLMPNKSLDDLLEKYPRLEKYFRVLYLNALVTQQHRIIQSFSATADERYLAFR